VVSEQHANTTPKVWNRLSGLAGSPITFLCLAAATLALAVKFALLYTALSAPAIPGWNWGDHPNTVLIAYRAASCGCGAHLTDAVSQGEQHHADVLVVASAADANSAGLAPVRADRRVRLISGIPSRTLLRLLPTGGTAVLNVQHGRIMHHITGSVLPDDFFQ
jgi:hypothetical protein